MKKLLSAAALVMAAFAFTACSEKKFHVEGSIENAKDSLLYFENISLTSVTNARRHLSSIVCALPDR